MSKLSLRTINGTSVDPGMTLVYSRTKSNVTDFSRTEVRLRLDVHTLTFW